MDTINNVANAASRAIWGEDNSNTADQSGREPLSGQTGNTARGEPYDAGNADFTDTDTTTSNPHQSDYANKLDPSVDSDRDGSATAGGPNTTGHNSYQNNSNTSGSSDTTSGLTETGQGGATGAPGNTAKTGPIRPEHDTDKTGVTSAHQPSSGFASDKPTSSNATADKGAEPSVGGDPASGAQQTQKQQGADRPKDAPEEGSDEHRRIQESKKEAEEAANVDTNGPGPVPLEEKAKNGGAAGGKGDEEDGPQKESHGEGTGEKYVQSSGMKADGGDFDAAAPGAGKEADRLLEQKGVHREGPGSGPGEKGSDDAGASDKQSKPSLGEKIKAKLQKS